MHPIDNIASLGYWIRRRRKVLDLTQEQLAQQVGCAVDTIKKIEADARRPSRPMAERIADCLQIPDEERITFLRVARAEVALHRAPLTVSSMVAIPSSKSEQPAHNLPVPANRLIGRGKEVRVVQALLQRADVRLVTLTGAGGIGKTRLALQVAHELQARTAADCWFVSLAPVQQASLVMPTIAQILGVSESAHQSSSTESNSISRSGRCCCFWIILSISLMLPPSSANCWPLRQVSKFW